MVPDHVETLIVGGGQAGLTMSHMLNQRGRAHLVLERGRLAERWRSERWEGLRFQFPNWSVRLPDWPFPHRDPDAFATSGEIADYLEAYARKTRVDVRCGVTVTALRTDEVFRGYVAETSAGRIKAAHVVVATGPYQKPFVPNLSTDDAGLLQIHSSAYKVPDQIGRGAVLTVGSGASGAQIAEELVRAGRQVYLSIGRHKRMPRRYRGHDLIWWLATMGLDQTPVEERGVDPTLPLITGAYGGHTIDFREFASQGVTLVGRLQSIRGQVLHFAGDLADSLTRGDAAYFSFLDRVDAYAALHGMNLPLEPGARLNHPDPPCVTEPVRRLDMNSADLGSIIWATGYVYDYSWIDLPVLDASGAPIHERGVAPLPGIYFLGLPWLSKMNSSFLSGVGDDAARLADIIHDRSDRPLSVDGAGLRV
jgi:putative flavoprotein involved in K+ transport